MTDYNEKLFQILIGVAWIDGEIQPQERKYLQDIATSKKLIQNQNIQDLLLFSKPISEKQCNQWIEDYLGTNPTKESCHNLISEIAGLVYCDDNVEVEEAKILAKIENYSSSNQILQNTLKTISNLYQKGLKKLT